MKSLYSVLIVVIISLSACMGTVSGGSLVEEKKVFFTEDEIKGYSVSDSSITFICKTSYFGLDRKATSVVISGSSNGWSQTADTLSYDKKNDYWTLTRPLSYLKPGNSGYPEFKYIIDFTWYPAVSGKPSWYKFPQKTGDNNIVLLEEDSTTDSALIYSRAMTEVTVYANDQDLTNFREVSTGNLGDKKLYRSYHPFIASRPAHPRETDRIAKLKTLIEDNAIASVINLSDSSADVTGSDFTYYKNLFSAGNVRLSVTDYNTVYYKSDLEDFGAVMKKIGKFVGTHNAPFLVHCRLGTDRTGMITAMLEGLMGATWKEIADDYDLSNQLGIMYEYRSKNLLRYSLEKMAGKTLGDNDKIEDEVAAFLKAKAGLTDEEITAMKNKLQ